MRVISQEFKQMLKNSDVFALRSSHVEDEENNCSRTYLVKDALSGELVCFTDCAKDVGLCRR